VELPIPVPAFIGLGVAEPGIVGFLRPVLILPAQLLERLNPRQLDAVLAHELCHVRRRDNFFAAIHMVVEAIFWFHPLVWWIGFHLVEERELACDEEVLRLGCEPTDYIEGILKVCRFYTESPLPCVSGVAGADIKKRLRAILTGTIARELNLGRKVVLAVAGLATLAVPIAIGVLNAPVIHAQATVTSPPAFDVASVRRVQRDKLNGPGRLRYNPQRVDFSNVPLEWVIGEAYGIAYNRISSSDQRIDEMFFSPSGTDYFFNIAAKAAQTVSKEQIRLMLQTLLAHRFSLVAHREPKVLPVYKLVAGKSGPKFQEAEAKGEPICSFGLDGFVCRNVEMARFARMLSQYMDRPVLDSTGLTASFDFTLSLQGGQAGGKATLVDWFSSSIFSDIERQLGLRLEADKGQVDYLVVDHVEQPSEN
jgi:bla regulator protein BlaR1